MAAAFVAPPLTAQTGKLFVVQTNAAGDNVQLIDPATDKIVAEIGDEEAVHGVAVAPDGSRIYLTNEALATLDIIDVRTLKLVKRIPLTGGPDQAAGYSRGAAEQRGSAGRPGARHPCLS